MNVLRFLFWTVPILIWTGIRLMLFVLAVTPGFFRFAWYYCIVADRTSIRYANDSARQTLDIYRPLSLSTSRQHQQQQEQEQQQQQPSRGNDKRGSSGLTETTVAEGSSRRTTTSLDIEQIGNNAVVPGEEECQALAPVLLFCTGGGWIIGYKMWGSFLARALTAAGIVVVMPDMRNYPVGTVTDMIHDVDASIEWTIQNIEQYGGDPSKIVLVGQSAGGHVACMAIFEKIRERIRQQEGTFERFEEQPTESNNNENNAQLCNTRWMPSDLKGYVSVSSPFRLSSMARTFKNHGLDDHIVDRIFAYQSDRYDPFLALQEFQRSEHKQMVSQELPPIRIYHGTSDKTVPHEVSEAFYRELQRIGTDESMIDFKSYQNWSHTDPILEGPMDADHTLHHDLFDHVKEWTDSSDIVWPANNFVIKDRLCPHFMICAGRFFNPF